MITPEDIICDVKAKRKNKFKVDTRISTGSATLEDYKKTGYDRGHLKSSADESCDQEQMDETFLMSNMSPQVPDFNRGIWKSLESHVRDLLNDNDSLYVYTAGVLTNDLPTIGENKVSVPKTFYKIVYIFNNGSVSSESYIIPNAKTSDSYTRYSTSISTIEELTNIDFPDLSVSFKFPK
jgi:endonuclease G